MLDAVNEALFTERPLEAEYRSAQAEDYREVRLHPLGLIRTGLVTYLVVCFDGYSDPRTVALHRLRRVRIASDGDLKAPPGSVWSSSWTAGYWISVARGRYGCACACITRPQAICTTRRCRAIR